MNPDEFFNKFLSSRDLSQPSGDPLYRYKVKKHEFTQVEEILNHTPELLRNWSACFVLYASEWWRRNYNGGYWSWEPIFKSINKSVPVNSRNEIVEDGFETWNRQIFEERGRRDFLGTVIIESGLPLKVLADEGHYLTSIITTGYQELGNISSIQYEYVDYLRDIANRKRLPQSLERDPFLHLLLEMITKLVHFKRIYQLSSVENPIEYLSQKNPNWRDQFPLRIDQNDAQNFVDNLLSEFSRMDDPPKHIINTSFELLKKDDGWICLPSLSIPSGSHDYRALGLTDEQFEVASSKLELFIETNELEKRIGFAFKSTTNRTFRIDGLDQYSLPKVNRSSEFSLFLSDPKFGNRIELDSGYENIMAYNEPALFEKKELKWFLKATGSINVTGGCYLLLTSPAAEVKCNSIQQISQSLENKDLYRIESECEISDDENIFRISFSGDDESFKYEFHPADNNKVIPFFEKENKKVFIGFPRIFKYSTNGDFSSRIISGLQYKGNNGWENVEDKKNLFGKVKIRYLKNGYTQFCRTISILPSDFKVKFGIENSSVSLKTHHDFLTSVKSNLNSFIREQSNGLDITFDANNESPEYFQLGIKSEKIIDESIIVVPFPKDQILFTDKHDEKLPQRSKLYLQALHGTRLSITNLSSKFVSRSLEIRLLCHTVQNISILKNIQIHPFSNRSISLITLKPEFERLFTLTNNLDAHVDLIFQGHVVEVRQYSSSPEIVESKYLAIKNTDEENGKINPLAFRFDLPFDQEKVNSIEYVPTSDMYKLPQGFGIWLIFPSEFSKVFFRPIPFNSESSVELPSENCQEIHEVAFASYQTRINALEKIVLKMTYDFYHPDWNRIDKMFKCTNHLPLATFDIWKAFAKNPEGLIALSLRLPNNITESLTTSFSILWHQFSVEDWIKTFLNFKEYINEFYPEFKNESLNTALNTIDNLLKLNSLKYIIELEVLKKHPRNVPNNSQLLRLLIMNHLNGEPGKPGLRARHDNERWPSQINDWIIENFKTLPQEIRLLLPKPREITDYQQGVIYLPFLLSSISIFNKRIDETNTKIQFKIQEIIDFDPEWFKDIYNLIHGYLWLNRERYE